MKKEEEHTHKQHRKKNEKHEKKLAHKKNKHKDKETQKAAKAADNESSDAIIERTKRTIIKKLIKHDAACGEDLPILFELLDKGDEVSLADMEDSYAKHKLYKLFKLFAVPHAPRSKYTFQGTATTSGGNTKGQKVSYKAQVLDIIRELAQEAPAKPDKKHKRDTAIEDNPAIPSSVEPLPKPKIEAKVAADAGADPGAKAEEGKKASEGYMKAQEKRPHDFLAKTMQVLERSEAEAEPLVGPAAPEAGQASEYASKKELLAEYNKIFRPKTLLEEHQDKMKKMKSSQLTRKKADRLNEFMARPFDRNKDLQVTRVGSKEAFQALYSNESLASKYTSSHFLQSQ